MTQELDMQLSKPEVISIFDVAKKLPHVAIKGPKMLKGLLIANRQPEQKYIGLGWAFEKAVKKNPGGVAIAYEDRRISYQVLDTWSNRVANYFLSLGVRKGDVIALYMENRPELLCMALAAAKTGAVLALVNTSQSGKVLCHSIDLVKAKHIVVGEELVGELEEVMSDLSVPRANVHWWSDTDTLKDRGTAPKGMQNLAEKAAMSSPLALQCAKHVFKDDGLFYIYTSGTTGMPKAVIFSHGRWVKAYGTFGHIMDLNQDDCMYLTLPLYHATGIAVCWSSVVKAAGTVAIRRKFSASNFWKDVKHFNASSFGYVGELCRYLLDSAPSSLDRDHRVTKMIGNGLRPNIWHEFKERFGIEEVYEFYASSEGNIGFSNIFNFENTVGFCPLPYEIVKYDKEKNECVRDKQGFCVKADKGEPGLLIGQITEKTPFDGYTDPEKNKAVIMENVFEQGDKYFNTGDLMRNIGFNHAQFVDRLGDTFRWKGENVSTTEVENILSGHEGIHEAIVYGVEISGTNGRAGMAAVTLNDGVEPGPDTFSQLCGYLKEELPHYAVPVFIRVQQMVEQTGTFKYSKNKLKEVGFDPSKTDEPMWVMLPGDSCYTPVDQKMFESIQAGDYRF